MASNAKRASITITEVNEVNQPIATIIYSSSPSDNGNGKGYKERIDIAHPPSRPASWSLETVLNLLIDVFLPTGYPHSVTDDYVPYQIFDSLQAFSSSIAGLLSSRAVLQGVGVGNADASPTSALLLHILQDSSGRLATILFAHRVGTALEPECKMYRLAADVFNDLAMVLDCLSPMIPAGVPRVTILSTAGVLRALCGVAGGSSKASLSAHFSRWGNLAEVNAKDSSQETVISLIGMLVGSFVVSNITSLIATWSCLLMLLALHLSLNYAAVRSVQMTTLNRQRASIVFSTLLSSDLDLDIHQLSRGPSSSPFRQQQGQLKSRNLNSLTPAQVAREEKIFANHSILKWQSRPLGSCEIGISLQGILLRSSSSKNHIPSLPILTSLFTNESYLLFITIINPSTHHHKASIILKRTCDAKSQLKAWTHALLAMRVLSLCTSPQQHSEDTSAIINVISSTLKFLNSESRFEQYVHALAEVGWDMGVSALETRPGRRVDFLL